MSKRLQVILDDAELVEIQRAARRERIEHIMRFDHGFDSLPDITRLSA